MINEIYIIDDDASSTAVFIELFKEDKDFKFININTENINVALQNIPLLIIINEDAVGMNVVDICKRIRCDENNSITPVIVVSSKIDREHRLEILNESIEYFIRKPVDEGYLYYTIKNLARLLTANRRTNPLTGLPGNIQIQAELKKNIAKNIDFTVLYFDLDNFKAYNDIYGFLKGDQILKFTADIINQRIHSNGVGFVGHIGGDDFVAIVPYKDVDKLCQDIIYCFDKQVYEYYSETDAKNGFIEVANRKGIIEKFPITSISIAAVIVDKGRFKNTLEIGDAAAQVKHASKMVMGSSYAIDRRKNKNVEG